MSSSSLRAKYRPIAKISVLDIYQMYSIYSKYYQNTKWRIFLADLSKKSGAFIIRQKSSNRIVGFSTVVNYPIIRNGKKALGVFSGDTIIEREFWGSRVLQMAFYKYMIALKFRRPFQSLYWLLISKGFKTYLLMSNNLEKYYPNMDNRNTDLADVVDDYCESLFSDYYDKEKKILDFGERYQCLKEGVAEIDEGLIQKHQKISFFEQRNPDWRRGTELPCVGVIDWRLLFGYVKKYLSKPVSQGRLEAKHETTTAAKPTIESEISFDARTDASDLSFDVRTSASEISFDVRTSA